MKKNYYITTPIYYPSAKLHLGHAYTTIAGDVLKRYKKLQDYNVFYLTGSDEHGEKIEKKATEAGVTPKEYVDEIVSGIKDLWKLLDIDYDRFIRTTDVDHELIVQKIFDKLKANGDIYKGEYEGLYCVSCETYITNSSSDNGKCPDCGGSLELVKEETYFLKCSKYVDKLMKHMEENENFILPISRKNELINNFIKPGLQDLAVSRTSFKWGIPVLDDEKHVIYVWIDALSNYITALGYSSDNDELFQQFWPADVHLVGKEIIRFHVIYWPIILMALGLELPKQIFAHGWLLMDKDKMSKSKGNVIYPEFLAENYGVDTIRYYLMREVSFGEDGQFTPETFVTRINTDLANDLGNLLNRTVSMTNKYFGGTVHNIGINDENTIWLNNLQSSELNSLNENMDKLYFSKALENLWKIISATNKYIDLTMPWSLAKEEVKKEELENVMYELLRSLHIISVYIKPFMPTTSKKIEEQLGVKPTLLFTDLDVKQDSYTTLSEVTPIYPRLDKEEEVTKIQDEMTRGLEVAKSKLNISDDIEFDDFKKVTMKVGKIVSCETHPNASKLLVFQVDLGNQTKQIISGLAKQYKPNELIGRHVQVVTNLKPVILRGEKSEGMLLTTSSNDDIKLIFLDEHAIGSELS